MTIRIPKFVLIALAIVALVGGGVALGVNLASDSSDGGPDTSEPEASSTSTQEPTSVAETTSVAEVEAILDAVETYRQEFEQQVRETNAAFAVCDSSGVRGPARRRCYNQAVETYAEDRVLLSFQALVDQVGPRCREALREQLRQVFLIEPDKAVDPCRAEAE